MLEVHVAFTLVDVIFEHPKPCQNFQGLLFSVESCVNILLLHFLSNLEYSDRL